MFRPYRREKRQPRLKRIFYVAALLTALGISHADAQEKNIHVELTPSEVQVIANALVRMPYGEVATTIADLQKQIDAQKSNDTHAKELTK